MKIVKIPFKILALPLIVIIWLVCLLAKVATHISAYVFGPIMLILGILLVVLMCKGRWRDVSICGTLELACFIVLFGTTWMIANMEDLNAVLIRFVHS